MSNGTKVVELISNVVMQFEQRFMGMNPKAVVVDLHESQILVTLTEVASVAERECANDPASRERMERLWSEAFDSVKVHLEAAVSEIMGRPVLHTRMSVDSVGGDAILSFRLF